MVYKSFFILPFMTKKILTEDGWEFESEMKISEDLEDELITALDLKFIENYLGVYDYQGRGFKMTVIKDDISSIESICFRVDSVSFNKVVELISSLVQGNQNMEIFIPSHK